MSAIPTSPRMRRILLAYSVNELGTWFGYVALAIGVYDFTHSALAVSGLFVAGRLLPALLTPALVARVETSTRGGRLSRLYLAEAVVAVGLALLLHGFWLPAVLVLVAIDGTAALAASALLRATAAQIAAEEARPITGSVFDKDEGDEEGRAIEVAQRKANAVLNVAFTTAVAVGPGIAGLFVAGTSGQAALLLDAISFLACGLLLRDRSVLAGQTHIEAEATSVRRRLVAAWEYLRAVPQLRALLMTEAVAVVFFASMEPVEVIYAKITLHAGDGGFGLLLAVWGVGMVLGSLVFARSVRRPLAPMLVAGTLLVGISYLGMAGAPDLVLACLAALVGGTGNGVQWASLISSVQKLTPAALQGRLMGAVESIGALCPAIGFILGGLVTSLSSPRVALLMAGTAASVATVVFLRITAEGPGSTPSASERQPEAKAEHLTSIAP